MFYYIVMIYKYLKVVYILNGYIIIIYSIMIENVIDYIFMNVFNCFIFGENIFFIK